MQNVRLFKVKAQVYSEKDTTSGDVTRRMLDSVVVVTFLSRLF
jgi:hypothetical protein